MKNIVPCKICQKNIEYIPGPAGNNRQLCDHCKSMVDEEELKRLEEESIIEKNRYLIDAPKRKDEYDPVNILVYGEMPEFKSDADKFVCAMEVATFLKRQKGGFCGMEEGLAKFMEHIGILHSSLLLRQFSLPLLDKACKHKVLGPVIKSLLKDVVVDNDDRQIYPEIETRTVLTRNENGWSCRLVK